MEDSVLKSFSDAIRSFTAIDDNDLDEIKLFCSVLDLKKNDFFLKEGQVCQQICFVNFGMLRHFYFTEHELTSSLQSFISGIPSIENIQAIIDCELVIFDRNAFNHLLDNNAGFKNLWIKALEYNYLTIENRVFSLIKKSAEERFEWMVKYQPQFILYVPVKYTSSMLGITTRHLSRLRKKYSF
jgi:CRP-like cAMP-binding protein